jgi:hypothetical protein
LAILDEAKRKWDHARALVEQATARKSGVFRDGSGALGEWNPERQLRKVTDQIRSVANDVANLLAEQPFTELGEEVRELVMLARGIPSRTTLYRMHELVNTVYRSFELAEKQLRRKDEEDSLR